MNSKNSELRGQKRISKADADLRDFLRQLFHDSPKSRIQIADVVEKIVDEPVSLDRLESFLASTKQTARLPAYFLPALAEALDSDEILLFLARPRTRKCFELGKQVCELRRIADELLKCSKEKNHG